MNYKAILDRAKSRKKHLQQTVRHLDKLPANIVDQWFHEADTKAFTEVDCLECANCCKTTGPLFTSKDIDRISKYLKLSPQQFVDQFLQLDEDNDYVLQSIPCKFLDESNYCKIYSVRPRACAEYPHTSQTGIKGIMDITIKNALICPAVAKVFDEIEIKLQKK